MIKRKKFRIDITSDAKYVIAAALSTDLTWSASSSLAKYPPSRNCCIARFDASSSVGRVMRLNNSDKPKNPIPHQINTVPTAESTLPKMLNNSPMMTSGQRMADEKLTKGTINERIFEAK